MSFRKSVLLLFAHPAFARSRANRALLSAARGVEGVTIHDLYEAYPDFDVDVAAEQALLEAHDVVVVQHPFFWYSTPALVKQWEDLVLEHGWAYGSEGTALHGKWWVSAITSGAPAAAYTCEGRNRCTMRELLLPLDRTARLCGMRFLPPFLVQGALGMEDATLSAHAAEYAAVLAGLRDGAYDATDLQGIQRLRAPALAGATPQGDSNARAEGGGA